MNADYQVILNRMKSKRQLLIHPSSGYFDELVERLESSSVFEVIAWAFLSVDRIYQELCIINAIYTPINDSIETVKAWSKGLITMRIAKPAILSVHRLAKETKNVCEQALIHAIGQGLSVVHTTQHALGLCCYEITALLHQGSSTEMDTIITHQINQYSQDLKTIRLTNPRYQQPWASFIVQNRKPSIRRS